MGTESLSTAHERCRTEFGRLAPLNIITNGERGQAILDSYFDGGLADGLRPCFKGNRKGALEWFTYDAESRAAEASPVGAAQDASGSDFSDNFKAGLIFLGGLGMLALMVGAFMKSILESVEMESGDRDRAKAERGEGLAAAEAERPTRVDVPVRQAPFDREAPFVLDDRPWEREEWFRMLKGHDQEALRMLIEQDLAEALKSRGFREAYVDAEDRLRSEGLRYLVDSREGKLLEGADLRVGSMRLARRSELEARRAKEQTRPIRARLRNALK